MIRDVRWGVGLCCLLTACGLGASEVVGGGDTSVGSPDATPADAAPGDANHRIDSGAPDATPADAGPTDAAEPTDAEPTDAEPTDAEPTDAQPRDAAPEDAQPRDAEPTDAQPVDAGPPDSGPRDTGPSAWPDASPRDASPADATIDAGTVDAGFVDGGSPFCAAPAAPVPYGTYAGANAEGFCFQSNVDCSTSCGGGAPLSGTQQIVVTPTGVEVFTHGLSLGYRWVEWNRSVQGSTLTIHLNAIDCGWNSLWTGQGQVTVDLDKGRLRGTFGCQAFYSNGCAGATESYYADVVGEYRCQEGQTRCLHGYAVTCDTLGTVTSSVPCGACGP